MRLLFRDRHSQPRNPGDPGPTAKALENLEKNLTAVEVQVYQVKNQSFEDPLNFPIMLNNRISSLQGVVESADTGVAHRCLSSFWINVPPGKGTWPVSKK